MRSAMALAASLAGLALIAGGLTGCSESGTGSSSGSVPPASASSEQVAKAYLDAAKSGDCALTKQLTGTSTWAWCDEPRLTGYKDLGTVTTLPASQAGVNLDCYHLTITATAAPKRGITAGTRPWTLCFEHTDQGYRLYEQGMR
ncbi:Uncharacterised protein [Acidipropionibacterium jensenii]|uniref:Lipoprotein n=1 Tax=Acidipropionibacterium jensenii TaxID=1749 RepID=A0A448NXC2_9ACTN|nr:hypothetical protein [Acidipropionibacterium jensenii]VEI02548.1 Uncharacterised protein [Acidipropionibacterium jensenii]